MKIYKDFKEVPMGMFLMKAFHESTNSEIFHIGLKISDAEWFNQAKCPVYSENIPDFKVFWSWAKENLPVFDYSTTIKSAI